MKALQNLFSDRARSIAMIVFLISGLPFLGIGVYQACKTDQRIKTGVKTVGVVTSYELVSDSDGDSYYPIVRFTTEKGETIIFTDSFGSSPPAFDVGETVNVLYDPQNVSDARINTWFRLWFLAFVFTAVGVVDVFIGINLLFGIIAHREEALE